MKIYFSKGYHGNRAATEFEHEGKPYKAVTMKRFGGVVSTTINLVKPLGHGMHEVLDLVANVSHGRSRATKKFLIESHKTVLTGFVNQSTIKNGVK